MILTVTLNPSVDMAYQLADLQLDEVNRAGQVEKTAGGKGLNVTRVLQQLGHDVTATGVVGGNFGRFITEQLEEQGIDFQFSPIAGESRSSIALLANGQQTEILEAGPVVSEAEISGFLAVYEELLQRATVVTISGSLAQGFPIDFYQSLINQAGEKGIPVLLDTSGSTLLSSLNGAYPPTLIKPNLAELSAILGEKLAEDDIEGLKQALENPMFAGIEWIVVSLGAKGAFAKHKERYYQVTIPKIDVKSPVGSGDATIAGLAAAISLNAPPENILKTGMTTGMLNAQEAKTGWITLANFEAIFEAIQVNTL